MKMKFIISTFLCAALGLTMFSCIDDQGNYNYKKTNEITFEGLEEWDKPENPFIAYLGKSATIKPTMVQTNSDDISDYTFLWLTVGSSKQSPTFHHDTVHVGQYIEDAPIPLAPKSEPYKMIYKAINNITGVAYTSDYFYIKMVGDIERGYFLLHEKDGEPLLRFLNYKAGDQCFEERFVDLSVLGDDPGKPINIVTYSDSNSPMINSGTNGYAVSLLTDKNLYRLKYDDFSYVDSTYKIDYIMFGDRPADFKIQQIYASHGKAANTALIKDQNGDYLYYLGGGINGQTFRPWTYGVMCNAYLVNGVRTPFTPHDEFIFVDTHGVAIFYDKVGKNIAYKKLEENFCTKYDVAEPKFKFNDVDYTPVTFMFKYYETDPAANSSSIYAIVKMNAGGYKLLSWKHSNGTQRICQDFNATEIENAKHFTMTYSGTSAAHGNYGALIFYATDTKIYCYDFAENTCTDLEYKLPAGNVISYIKMEVGAAAGSTTSIFMDNLIVVTNSASGADTSTFEIFQVEKLKGTLTIRKDKNQNEMRWTGLPGIIAVDLKNKG